MSLSRDLPRRAALDIPASHASTLIFATHDFPTAYAGLFNMFSNDCTMDITSKTLRRETSTSFKRSVHSMKSLLPLKLLSPTLPPSDLCPSTSQDHRLTSAISTTQETLKIRGQTTKPLSLRLSLLPPRPSQRDTPIYNEPGSPLPGRVYYTSDDLCLNCSSPGSSYCEGYVFHELRCPYQEIELCDEVASQSNTYDAFDFRRRSYVSEAPRSSGLSFQCSGEELFPIEAATLSSSSPSSPKSDSPRHHSTNGLPLESNVESWLSDTASEIGENVLACATTLSPTKANMVEVSTYRLFDDALPPRVTSPDAPSSTTLPVGERYSWASSDDSPPDTPTGECEFDDNRSPCRDPQWIFPDKRFDLAMTSPPMSPKVFPDPTAASRFSFSVMGAEIENDEDPSMASRWSFDSTASEQKSNVDIITDLEEIVSGFPSNMLLPECPCISEIRLLLSSSGPRNKPPNSIFPHEPRPSFVKERKSVANFSRPRRITYLSSSQNTPMSQPTSCQPSYRSSLSTTQTQLTLPPPDLAPLSRIFPSSSEYTQLALYAHLVAYIFIASLPTIKPANRDVSPRRRRDTPYWMTSPLPSKEAAVLSHPRTSNSYTYSSESGLQRRILDLQSGLRKCILRLMNNMDSSICQANDEELGSGRGELMLRAVEEIVRGSEKLAFGMF